MKAIVTEKYGNSDVIQIKEVNQPVLADDHVLVRVKAASINYGNLALLTGKPFLARFVFGLTKPKFAIPGGDMSGVVEAVGSNVAKFQEGDEVFADLSGAGWGSFAEYVSVPESVLVRKPVNLSFEEAAAVPMAAVTALQALRDKARVQPDQKVLVYGASGGVGTFAVQITKALGAKVTAVCSTRNVEIVRSIGADTVIDYKVEDFTKKSDQYDVILGTNGNQPISVYKSKLRPGGMFICVGGSGSQLFQSMVRGVTNSKQIKTFLHRPKTEDLVYVRELIEAGKVKPVIDRSYTLAEVPEAFTYFAEGHAQGKVVIQIQ
ncbi:NAD(P)-dependent alcohol dehydrogenase [Fictibacillus iocasae]|uniref:NAD(P)-dependent alcohol dehydrogenase n=1 Tax=Fictibacillus iocasae TaxID=2715437 RepID=A0ABW2NTB3_9BACL